MEIKAIQQECAKCKLSRGYDWIKGLSREKNLEKHGWRKQKDRWICPDCVSERKRRSIDDLQKSEKENQKPNQIGS